MSNLTDFRAAKDVMFGSEDSPLTPEQRADFEGLAYYPEDPSHVFVCTAEKLDGALVRMQTSRGEEAEYLRSIRVRFNLGGEEAALTIYADTWNGDLFLPFQDAGRGAETYDAGRYLDVEQLGDGRLLLDFNYAYNPYCAYNDEWSCPLTPAENQLAVYIRAGEMVFPGAQYGSNADI